MGRNLYISDLHIGSERIIRLCGRPFADVDEMDAAIERNWREAVRPGDTVYILGDLAEADHQRAIRLLKRLPGRKVLVLGNHDTNEAALAYRKSRLFAGIRRYDKTMDFGKEIILSHYPMMDWEDRQFGSIHIYGHIHNKDLPEIREYYKDKPCYNCGADVIGFTPRTLEELMGIKEAQL